MHLFQFLCLQHRLLCLPLFLQRSKHRSLRLQRLPCLLLNLNLRNLLHNLNRIWTTAMAKNPRRQQQKSSSVQLGGIKTKTTPVVSQRGWKVIATGVAVVLLGFWILTYTDPAGQNWASALSPALIVIGYALIGVGIVLPDASPAEVSSPLPPV